MRFLVVFFVVTVIYTSVYSQSVEDLDVSSQLQFVKGDYLGVIESLNQVLKNSDKNGNAYYYRGLSKTFMGDKPGGCSDLSVAKSLGVKPPDKRFYGFICDDTYKLKFLKKNFYPHTELLPEMGFRPAYTRKDTIRGSLRPERTCFDVTYYDLKVKLEPKKKFISGENNIYFKVVSETRKIQIDLFSQYSIEEILWEGQKLNYTREYDAVFIIFSENLPANSLQKIRIVYSGNPQKAENPPWFGGFVWKKDKKGNRWDGVACEYLGASSWWPCKDHMSDEPDSANLTFICPKDYDLISNGTLREEKKANEDFVSHTWFVSNPINCYDITFYMGKFRHFSDSVTNSTGTYPLDYYVLPYNLEKAKEAFKQVKEVILVYEDLFGDYPFAKDGFGMVESPFEGMEHQGAIAYGNNFNKKTSPYIHKEYDYIIVHETAHEWWGNSVSAADMADMWLQEGFATYAELLFMERRFGYGDYLKEVTGKMYEIFNFWPLVENRDVNENSFASNDVYTKGAVILHNLRCTINNDSLFFNILKDFATKYKKKVVTSSDFIQLVNEHTGKDFNPFFDKFLKETGLPVLHYRYIIKDRNIVLKYYWEQVKSGFEMPFCIRAGNSSYRLEATTSEKEIELKNAETFRFYNMWSGTEGVEKNAYTYFWTRMDE